jgi:polyisoprenoid-binding protein YceI
VDGLFREVSGNGTVCADGAISGAITVAAASIDTQNTRRDTHLRSADFFDSSSNPDIVFSAEGIRPSGQGAKVTGTLTVRGRTRPLSVDASASVQGQGDAEVWLDGVALINRADFGLTWNPMGMAGVNSTLTIHLVFTRR